MPKLRVVCVTCSPKEAQEAISQMCPEARIKVDTGRGDGFALEPASLIISGAGVVSATLAAYFAYLGTKHTSHIVIKATDQSGKPISIEYPASLPPAKVDEILEVVKRLSVSELIIK
jgi:hypothetical protein